LSLVVVTCNYVLVPGNSNATGGIYDSNGEAILVTLGDGNKYSLGESGGAYVDDCSTTSSPVFQALCKAGIPITTIKHMYTKNGTWWYGNGKYPMNDGTDVPLGVAMSYGKPCAVKCTDSSCINCVNDPNCTSFVGGYDAQATALRTVLTNMKLM
jgi:hypothetical protein